MMLNTIKRMIKMTILNGVHIYDNYKLARIRRGSYSLSPEAWDMSSSDAGHLEIQGQDVVELCLEYGSPLYVINHERLRKNYLEFYNAFHRHYPKVDIGYSYKTNPLPGVLSALHDMGACAEVISHFELWLALKLGVLPENIIYNGPGKTQESLELAVSSKVKIINIDGPQEIEKIANLATKYKHKQSVGVRLITSVGWSSQFGLAIDSGAAFNAFEQLSQFDQLDPCGIHVHLGTGIRDLDIYLKAIREVLEFARSLTKELNIDIRFFDFGGGFGVPTVKEYSLIDSKLIANGFPPRPIYPSECPEIKHYGEKITALMIKYYPDRNKDELPTIMFEPGRAITSSAQILLLEVVAAKPATNGTVNLILNGGKNISFPTGYEYHELFPASKMKTKKNYMYNIFGPLCHPGDMLFKSRNLPQMEPGDIIAIMDAGAYFVPNQMNFSNPRPAAVMMRDGDAVIIRERELFEDIIRKDKV